MIQDYYYSKHRMYCMREIYKDVPKEERLKSYIYKTVQNERYLSFFQLVDRIHAYFELATERDRPFIKKWVSEFRKIFPQKSIRRIRKRVVYEIIYG